MKKEIYTQKVNIKGQHYWKKVENLKPTDKVIKKVGDKVKVWKRRKPYSRKRVRYILTERDLREQFLSKSLLARQRDLMHTSKEVLTPPIISTKRFFDFRRADIKGIDTARLGQGRQNTLSKQLQKQLEKQIKDDLWKELGEVKDNVKVTESGDVIELTFEMKNIDGSRSGLENLVEALAKDYHLKVITKKDKGKYRIYRLTKIKESGQQKEQKNKEEGRIDIAGKSREEIKKILTHGSKPTLTKKEHAEKIYELAIQLPKPAIYYGKFRISPDAHKQDEIIEFLEENAELIEQLTEGEVTVEEIKKIHSGNRQQQTEKYDKVRRALWRKYYKLT